MGGATVGRRTGGEMHDYGRLLPPARLPPLLPRRTAATITAASARATTCSTAHCLLPHPTSPHLPSLSVQALAGDNQTASALSSGQHGAARCRWRRRVMPLAPFFRASCQRSCVPVVVGGRRAQPTPCLPTYRSNFAHAGALRMAARGCAGALLCSHVMCPNNFIPRLPPAGSCISLTRERLPGSLSLRTVYLSMLLLHANLPLYAPARALRGFRILNALVRLADFAALRRV